MKRVYLFLFLFILIGNLFGKSISLRAGDKESRKKGITTYTINNLNNPILDITLSKNLIKKEKIGTFTNKRVIICDKELGGSFEYLDKNRVRLYIESKLTTSTTYKCRVNKKLFPKINQKLIIKTKDFSVDEAKLIKQIDSYIIQLKFNDVVNYSSLQNSLSLKDSSNLNVDFEIFPKKDSNIYNILYSNKIKIVDLKLENLENSSFKKLNYEKEFNGLTELNSLLEDYDIDNFPVTPVYAYDGTIYFKFQYLGEIENRDIKNYISIYPETEFHIVKIKREYWEKESKLEIRGDFKANREYQITFKKGLRFEKDDTLYELKEDNIKEVITGDRRATISFINEKNYLSSKGRDILVKVVNNPKIKVVVEKLIDRNFDYFVNFKASRNSYYNFYKYSDIVFKKIVDTKCKKNEICQISLKTDELNISKNGVYRIKLYRDSNNEYEYAVASKILNYSDISINAKVFHDEIFVNLSSLSTNRPFYNAKVRIFDDKNRIIVEGKSDYFGIFRGKVKNLACKNPISVIVSTDSGDKNYLLLNSAINNFDIGCDNVGNNRIESFIYLDREIARPNDKINALFVIKDNQFSSKANSPFKIVITDPVGTTIYKKVLKSDEYGVIEKDIAIPNDYKTGRYNIKVYYFNKEIGYKEFLVEDFIPQKIKNSLKVDKESYFINEPIKVRVGSRYLFGTPASGLKAEVSFSVVKREYKSKKYPDYSFSDENPYEDVKKLELDKVTKDIILDENGSANLIFKQNFVDTSSILQGMISLTVFDDGRGVSNYKTFDIFTHKNLVGIKRVNSGFGESGNSEKFKFILIDTKDREVAPRKLSVEIKRAIYYYYSDSYDIDTIYKTSINSNEELTFTPEESGSYIVTVTDPLYGDSSSTTFYVSGWSYDPVVQKKESKKVDILVKEGIYKAGDEIKIGIKSPLSGRMILTIEDSRLLDYKVIDLKNNTATLNLQVPYGVNDSFYIKAYVIRSTGEDNKIVPFRAFGKKFIKVDKSIHKAKVDFTIKPRYFSKSKATFNIESNIKEGYLILSIVDKGILNIVGQVPPKPFDFFLTKEYETSSIYDFYDNLIAYIHKKVDKYGSGVALHLKMKKHLPPNSLNRRVKPFSFYSKRVKLINGRATISVDIPNFNGKARVVAIVVNKDKIGATSKDILIKDNVIVKPTFPRFMSKGDILKVPVRIFNTTEEKKVLNLKVEAKNVEVTFKDKNVSLSPKSSILKYLTIKAVESPNSYIKVLLSDKDKIYYSDVEIPINERKSLKSFTKGGESDTLVNFKVSKKIFKRGNPFVNISISKTYLSQFKKDFNDLVGYPYGCAEQTSSKMLAMLNSDKFLNKIDKNYQNRIKEAKFYIISGIDKLSRMQNYDGRFYYWPSGDYINDFASIYASDILLEANEKGFEVSKGVINRIYNALNDYANGSSGITLKLYSLYLLSKYQNINLALVNSIYDNDYYYDTTLTNYYFMAILLKKANLEKEFKKVYKEIEDYDLTLDKEFRSYGGDFHSFIRDVAFALYLHLENLPKDKISRRLLEIVVKYIRDNRLYSTQDRAFVMRALSSYYKNQTSDALNATLIFNSTKYHIKKAVTVSGKLEKNYIGILPENNTTINYLIELNYRDKYKIKNIDIDKSRKELAIQTKFYDREGRILNMDNIKVNDKIYMEVNLKSNIEIENIVVNVKIPSNFEIVNIRLNKEDKSSIFKDTNFKPKYRDIRDDRELIFLDINGYATFYIPLRAVTKGVSYLPPVITEAMYDSRINDYAKPFETMEVK